MAINLEDFFYLEPLNKKTVLYNPEKALALSDENFIEHYNQLMNTYGYLFEDDKKVNCNKCHEKISGTGEFVRYMGANIHQGECIKQVVESEKYWANSSQKKYFQRIASLTNPVIENFQ